MRRGVDFGDIKKALLDFTAKNHLDREAASIGATEASALHDYIGEWFLKLVRKQTIFVPCQITPWAAPRFSIGPVVFLFVDEAARSEFYAPGDHDDAPSRDGFDGLLQFMKKEHADWLACVPIEGCEHRRAEEIGALAVDLAIVALQLAAPYLDTRTMSRMDARRGRAEKGTLSEANGYYSFGWARMEPGLAIGPGTLADILQTTGGLIEAVGNRVRAFTTGCFQLPFLEQAWCDAAYWLHEALAEPIDSIAVAKLETSLEVLLRAENTKGSEARLMTILDAFYGLKADDPISEGSTLKAKQFAKNVVRGRSRILHGTWSTLGSRTDFERTGLEGFVTAVIRRAALELDEYAAGVGAQDGVEEFLAWVKARERLRGGRVSSEGSTAQSGE